MNRTMKEIKKMKMYFKALVFTAALSLGVSVSLAAQPLFVQVTHNDNKILSKTFSVTCGTEIDAVMPYLQSVILSDNLCTKRTPAIEPGKTLTLKGDIAITLSTRKQTKKVVLEELTLESVPVPDNHRSYTKNLGGRTYRSVAIPEGVSTSPHISFWVIHDKDLERIRADRYQEDPEKASAWAEKIVSDSRSAAAWHQPGENEGSERKTEPQDAAGIDAGAWAKDNPAVAALLASMIGDASWCNPTHLTCTMSRPSETAVRSWAEDAIRRHRLLSAVLARSKELADTKASDKRELMRKIIEGLAAQ